MGSMRPMASARGGGATDRRSVAGVPGRWKPDQLDALLAVPGRGGRTVTVLGAPPKAAPTPICAGRSAFASALMAPSREHHIEVQTRHMAVNRKIVFVPNRGYFVRTARRAAWEVGPRSETGDRLWYGGLSARNAVVT